MEKQLLLFDVDGTLYMWGDEGNYIPDSTKQAIQQAKENGHLIYLCTGRGLAEITPDLYDLNIDGLIGAAGGLVIVGNEKVSHQKLSLDDLKAITTYFNNNDIIYYLETNTYLYASTQMMDFVRELPNSERFLALFRNEGDCDLNDVNKISFVSMKPTFEDVENHFNGNYHLVKCSWMKNEVCAGEISLKGITKGSAIEYLVSYLGMDMKNTFGFGDSMNDIEMFQTVNTSIVMAHAMHGVEKYATYQTIPGDDGIAHAMKKYGLID